MTPNKIKQWDRVSIKAPAGHYQSTGVVISTMMHGIPGLCLVKYDYINDTGKHMYTQLEFVERPPVEGVEP